MYRRCKQVLAVAPEPQNWFDPWLDNLGGYLPPPLLSPAAPLQPSPPPAPKLAHGNTRQHFALAPSPEPELHYVAVSPSASPTIANTPGIIASESPPIPSAGSSRGTSSPSLLPTHQPSLADYD